MGMPATNKRVWTADEVRRLNEAVEARGMRWPRYELIDGELLGGEMTPAPNSAHQEAVLALAERLRAYLRRERLGRALVAPADVRLTPERVVQPDVFVVPREFDKRVEGWTSIRTLLLAIEILSPHSAREDRVLKRRIYQRAGVPEYWIVDLDARAMERWRPADERPEVLDTEVVWHPEGVGEPLVLDLGDVFRDVFGDEPPPSEPEGPPA
jgi:Uma2 family endonuclease